MNVNSCTFVGRIAGECILTETPREGKDPSVRLTGRVIVNRDKSEESDGFSFVLWGAYATAMAPYLKKGKEVYLNGAMRTNRRERAGEPGKFDYFTELRVDKCSLGQDSTKNQTDGARAASGASRQYIVQKQPDGSIKRIPVAGKTAAPATNAPQATVSPELLAQLAALLAAQGQAAPSQPAQADTEQPENPFEDSAI